MHDSSDHGEASRVRSKAGVAKFDNSDKSKYVGFKDAVLRFFAKLAVQDEVKGLYLEHIIEDGCMLVAPGPASDLEYLTKFKAHLIPPVIGQSLLDWNDFNNCSRARTSQWKNRQRECYNELAEFFHGDGLDVLLIQYAFETENIVS